MSDKNTMDYKTKCLNIFYASDVVNKELTFGCEVQSENGSTAKIVKFYEGDTFEAQMTKEYDGVEAVVTMKDCKLDKVTVLGHPPQLQDWLALLRKKLDESRWYLKSDGRVMWQDNGVNFEKVKFNLTTGQPATEADWEALYELIA